MSPISWNDVRDRALRFSREWADATDEERDKQTFWNEFFEVFGIPRKSVATFEKAVAKAEGGYGFVDLFWRGVLLVEHKSAGQNLSKAESQAFDYIAELTHKGLHEEVPRYVILSDFRTFVLFDLEPDKAADLAPDDEGQRIRIVKFPLSDLSKMVREFAFIKGEQPVRLNPDDPANLKATQLLADLHDALASSGFTGHSLERVLVRILFCLFAEDSGIFDVPSGFTALVERTREDGSDLGLWLAQLFQVLNTPEDKRQKSLDEDLAAFPYVNGALFDEQLPFVSFIRAHREALLACTRFHWARISPAVFGSLFQGVLDARERRQAGAHYTSERDIMKVLRGLFLDELRAELDAALADRSTRRVERLRDFQKKLRRLRFFDPACGCGNFLILAYRELRRLEQEALIAIHTVGGRLAQSFDVSQLSIVDVDQFYGLEIAEWPVRIAEVGLWLADHQANQELGAALGQSFRRLPLKASPTLRVVNALRTDWREFLPPSDEVYVLGNPPFVGKHLLDPDQTEDMALVWGNHAGAGFLDYVSGWYRKTADYIQGSRIRCALVSTNSITQGEQAGVLWNYLFERFHIKIHFAYRTFAWESEARGKAHVHVVIIGFGAFDIVGKRIFESTTRLGAISQTTVTNISPYLIEGSDIALPIRRTPLCNVPEIVNGNKPADGGSLIIEPDEYTDFIRENPAVVPFIRQFVSAEQFLNGKERWVLWLTTAEPEILRESPGVRSRLTKVREFRMASKKASTRRGANSPALFDQIRQPTSSYILIPRHSSEQRRYIPLAYFTPDVIIGDSCTAIPDATIYHFGVLTSSMHMAWVKTVCGRLKSDYRYSNKLVYNNFPWPVPTDKDHTAVEGAGRAVLDARSAHPYATLADLYDPLTMPTTLLKAHAALDRAVDRCYRRAAFGSDRERVEHLFALYEQLSAPLLPTEFKTSRKGRHPR